MSALQIIQETQPVHVIHDTYRRECRYMRGIQIPLSDFEQILLQMNSEAKEYFEFHNIAKKIEIGTLLNGFAGLAKAIATYYKQQNVEIRHLTNGKDFYVKLI